MKMFEEVLEVEPEALEMVAEKMELVGWQLQLGLTVVCSSKGRSLLHQRLGYLEYLQRSLTVFVRVPLAAEVVFGWWEVVEREVGVLKVQQLLVLVS